MIKRLFSKTSDSFLGDRRGSRQLRTLRVLFFWSNPLQGGPSPPMSLSGPILFAAGFAAVSWLRRRNEARLNRRRIYNGGCHCGGVQFSCTGPEHLVVWQCDCTFCDMLKNWHFIIPEQDFRLTGDSDRSLTLYQFNTRTAKHLFCRVCGVSPFYRPRSNPDGYAVTLACVNKDQVNTFEYRYFNGLEWEEFHSQSGISKFSRKA